jgi:hypothetical protein
MRGKDKKYLQSMPPRNSLSKGRGHIWFLVVIFLLLLLLVLQFGLGRTLGVGWIVGRTIQPPCDIIQGLRRDHEDIVTERYEVGNRMVLAGEFLLPSF